MLVVVAVVIALVAGNRRPRSFAPAARWRASRPRCCPPPAETCFSTRPKAKRDAEVTRREAGIEGPRAGDQAPALISKRKLRRASRRSRKRSKRARDREKKTTIDRKAQRADPPGAGPCPTVKSTSGSCRRKMKETEGWAPPRARADRRPIDERGRRVQRILDDSQEQVRHEARGPAFARWRGGKAATEAKRRARNLVADALQRVAASAAAEGRR